VTGLVFRHGGRDICAQRIEQLPLTDLSQTRIFVQLRFPWMDQQPRAAASRAGGTDR
jgi:hypothetical protein